jgi:hypothetical protein
LLEVILPIRAYNANEGDLRRNGTNMSKGKQNFRRTDLMRAIKAARDAGLGVSGVRINKEGQIEVVAGPLVDSTASESANELEHWLSKKGLR